MCIYLYVKTHTKTGLKYLGKTKRNPYTYNGSGIDWKQHLKEHGSEGVETRILVECQTNEQINHWGRFYSELWNIVESKEWANRIPETGGGFASATAGLHMCSPENRERMRNNNPAKTAEARQKISNKLKGIPKSEEHKKNMFNPMTVPEIAAKRKGKKNPMFDHKIYHFINKLTNEECISTQSAFRAKYNLLKGNVSSLISGRSHSYKGWVIVL